MVKKILHHKKRHHNMKFRKGKFKKVPKLQVVTLNKLGMLFPERLRAKGKVAYNIVLNFSGGAVIPFPINTSSPISVFGSQNMSGLRWLIGQSVSNGNSQAPYSHGIVVGTLIKVYAQTDQTATNNTAPLVVLYPQGSVNQSTDTLNVRAKLEQPRAKVAYLSPSSGTNYQRKPVLTTKQFPYLQAGLDYKVFRSASENWFNYNTPPTNSWYQALNYCTQNEATDTTLSVNSEVVIEYLMEFFDRNQANLNAPS